MGRNHNLYNGVRIGAPLIYADNLIDADNVANGRPIRNVAERFRESSTFLPSVGWTFDDNITDATPAPDVSSSGTEQKTRDTDFTGGVRRIQVQEDGQKIWIMGRVSSTHTRLKSFTLSVPFELGSMPAGNTKIGDLTYSTFDYWRLKTTTGTDITTPGSWHWSVDGMRGYLFHSSANVYQYECSAPYTLVSSTNTQNINADSVVVNLKNASGTHQLGVNANQTFISRDGRYLFVTGTANAGSGISRFINKFELSTPWDITGSFTTNQPADQSIDADVFSQFAGVDEMSGCPIFFSPDGTRMFLQNDSTQVVYQFELSTPWDLDTINTTEINTFDPTDSTSDRFSPTYDGKYFYFHDAAEVFTMTRYSQVKHGGNI